MMAILNDEGDEDEEEEAGAAAADDDDDSRGASGALKTKERDLSRAT